MRLIGVLFAGCKSILTQETRAKVAAHAEALGHVLSATTGENSGALRQRHPTLDPGTGLGLPLWRKGKAAIFCNKRIAFFIFPRFYTSTSQLVRAYCVY